MPDQPSSVNRATTPSQFSPAATETSRSHRRGRTARRWSRSAAPGGRHPASAITRLDPPATSSTALDRGRRARPERRRRPRRCRRRCRSVAGPPRPRVVSVGQLAPARHGANVVHRPPVGATAAGRASRRAVMAAVRRRWRRDARRLHPRRGGGEDAGLRTPSTVATAPEACPMPTTFTATQRYPAPASRCSRCSATGASWRRGWRPTADSTRRSMSLDVDDDGGVVDRDPAGHPGVGAAVGGRLVHQRRPVDPAHRELAPRGRRLHRRPQGDHPRRPGVADGHHDADRRRAAARC